MNSRWPYKTHGIPDDLFIRGQAPMTKLEIRSVTLSKLMLKKDDKIVDIGAGTGSISIECALTANKGKVYSVEKKDNNIKLIQQNINAFNVKNIELIKGTAPEIIKEVSNVDKVIIGGSGGKLDEIFQWLEINLNQGGRLVMNFITLENMYRGLELLKIRSYKEIDVVQISVSKGRSLADLTMMEGYNPVYIISAAKE